MDFEIGKKSFFGLVWYQPLRALDDIYFSVGYRAVFNDQDVDPKLGKYLADKNIYHRMTSGFGYNFTRQLVAEIGFTYDVYADRTLSSSLLDTRYKYHGFSPYFKFQLDNRNNLLFPTSGHYFHVQAGYIRQQFNEVDIDFYADSLADATYFDQEPVNFWYYQTNYDGTFHLGANVFSFNADYEKLHSIGEPLDPLPALNVSMYRTYLGGFKLIRLPSQCFIW